MPITINTDKLYDTDLTDAAWALIGPMLPEARLQECERQLLFAHRIQEGSQYDVVEE